MFDIPGVERGVRAARPARAPASTPASTTGCEVSTHYDADAGQGHLLGARPGSGAPRRARRRAGPRPAARRDAPTATCWSACCASRRSSPATPTPPSSTRTGLLGGPRARRGRRAVAAVAAAIAAGRGRPAAPHGPAAACPVAWRNVVSQPQVNRFRRRRGRASRSHWCGGRDGYVVRRRDGAGRLARPAYASSWTVSLSRPTSSGRRGPRRRAASLRRLARLVGPAARRPTVHRPGGRRSRAGRCWRRCRAPWSGSPCEVGDAGHGRAAAARGWRR